MGRLQSGPCGENIEDFDGVWLAAKVGTILSKFVLPGQNDPLYYLLGLFPFAMSRVAL
jgi:hypothetical protein